MTEDTGDFVGLILSNELPDLQCTGWELFVDKPATNPDRNITCRVAFGHYTKAEGEQILAEFKEWVQDEGPDGYKAWAESFHQKKGRYPLPKDINEVIVKEKGWRAVSDGKQDNGLMNDPVGQLESKQKLRQKMVGNRKMNVSWNPNNSDLEHVCDEEASGVIKRDGKFDRLPKNEKGGFMYHSCQHVSAPKEPGNHTALTAAPRGDGIVHDNEHCRFSVDEYTRIFQSLPSEDFSNAANLYEQVREEYEGILNALGYPSLEEYLKWVETQEYAVVGSYLLEHEQCDVPDVSPGDTLRFSPHVTRPGANKRSYACTSFTQACIMIRYKADRNKYYGPGKRLGKRATIYLIEGKFRAIMERVGLTGNSNTPDLACSLLPLPIHTMYEVVWKSVGIHDADFRKLYEDYKWI